jgi:hypothetical protein
MQFHRIFLIKLMIGIAQNFSFSYNPTIKASAHCQDMDLTANRIWTLQKMAHTIKF